MDWIITPSRLGGAATLLAGYIALCASIAWQRARQRQALLREQQSLQSQSSGPKVLVTYASQTGQAEALAHETARVLHTGGCAVRLQPLQSITLSDLKNCDHSLWLLSTTGEGDAPDHALPFVRDVLEPSALANELQHHHSLVLALGDRAYTQFCAFGHRIQQWLQSQNADVFTICMDGASTSSSNTALRNWQDSVAALLPTISSPGTPDNTCAPAPAWDTPTPAEPWVLHRRTHLNPGSQGSPVYLLEWQPKAGVLPMWESGDLVSLAPPADPDRPRDYSIASIPQDGHLQLLVRQNTRGDGTPGAASSWLCHGMAIGDSLPITIRPHNGFRLHGNATRALVLIGNGTGLAGLVSHIRARIAQGPGGSDTWLLFGERSPTHDALLDTQLQQWLAQGQLKKLDHAWSRDTRQPSYVQHVLAREAATLHEWVAQGAALYVCGSLQGMAQEVDATLRQILGDTEVDALAAGGRYRRDVY